MRIIINYFFRKGRKTSGGNSPVYLKFTFNNKRVELSTGIYVSKDSWDKRKQRIKEKTPGSRVLKEQLDKIKTEIQESKHSNSL